MNPYLLAAAAVTALLAVAHSWIGERLLITPLSRRNDLPELMGDRALAGGTVRFAWHITSVFAIGCAALLVVLAGRDSGVETPARILALTLALSGVLSLVIARARHPAWIIFFTAAILTWRGAG